ncbi:hypothetical protein [Streptomyces sp. NPDC058812]|uniref:hypothetical protein n=1 Tax=unclassified Streptomyces TaxID=2593676 RepID=UPI00369790B3
MGVPAGRQPVRVAPQLLMGCHDVLDERLVWPAGRASRPGQPAASTCPMSG